MLRTLSRVSELPIVVRQLQKVRNCNAAVAVTNNKTIVTVTNTKQQQHAKQSNISNIRNNSSNCRRNNTSGSSSSSTSKGGSGSSQWITRQQQLQQQLRYASRRSYSSSFFGLFQNAAQAGVAKTNNYATEATVQVNRVSSSSSREYPPKMLSEKKTPIT